MAELDPDMYDVPEDGTPVKVAKEEYIDRKRHKIKEQIKYHQLMIWVLEEQFEQTTTIQLTR